MKKYKNHSLLIWYVVDFLVFGIASNIILFVGDLNENKIYLPVAFFVYSLVIFSLIYNFKCNSKNKQIFYLFIVIISLFAFTQYLIAYYTKNGIVRDYLVIYAIYSTIGAVIKLSDISNSHKKVRRFKKMKELKKVKESNQK